MPSSRCNVVVSTVGVKEWIDEVPSVDRLRPDRCPHCQKASRPVGEPLKIWGHGLRDRQFLGLFQWGADPSSVTIRVRRFLCRHPDCGRTITVLPREASPRRRYLLGTIVFALALWVVGTGESTTSIRRRLSADRLADHHTAWRGWPQLLGWAEQLDPIDSGHLPVKPRKKRAERIVQHFASRAPPSTRGLGLVRRAFIGAGGQSF